MLGQFLLKMMPKMLCQFLISTGIIHWMTDFFKYSQRTLADVMEELTDNKDLRAVLSYCFGDYGRY
jgi:all-trans-retinol 13,14-reductase